MRRDGAAMSGHLSGLIGAPASSLALLVGDFELQSVDDGHVSVEARLISRQ